MAPKKKQKTGPTTTAEPVTMPTETGLCQAHLLKVHDALQCIFAHEMFKDIRGESPLSPTNGGRESPLDLSQAAAALKSVGVYRCAGNFFHQDLLWLATHKIPINNSQVQQIKDYWFPPNAEPSLCPFTINLAVEKPTSVADRPEAGFARLSPAEPVHALLFALAEAIQRKAPEHVLRAFKSCVLTASFVFEICGVGEARYWRAQNIREEMVEKGLAVQMTLRQRIFDIAGFHEAKSKTETNLGSKKLAGLYSAHLKLASSQERISESFVDSALTIHRRLLSQPACQQVLEWCDQNWLSVSPWKSIYALQALIDRAGTPEMIAWALPGMVDGVRMSFLDAGVFVISKLKDSRVSYIEILKMKKKVLQHLLTEWLMSLELPTEWKNKIKSTFSSFEKVRGHFAPYPQQTADTAWLLGAPTSVSEISTFLEGVIYGQEYDGRYKDGIKNRHEVQDFLAYSSVKSTMENLGALVRQEARPQAPNAPQVEEKAEETETAEAEASEAAPASVTAAEAAPASTLTDSDAAMWRQHMRKVVQQHVRFVSDHRSNADLEEAPKETPFMSLRGDQTGMALFHFDLKKYGEPTTRPDLRIATFREALYTRLVKSVLNARKGATDAHTPHLQVSEVALLFDGGKKGLRNKLLAPWREGTASKADGGEEGEEEGEEGGEEEDDKPTLFVDLLQIGYSEQSLAARKKRVRGTCTIKQMEQCHVLSAKKLTLPSRDRKHFDGSTAGDLITNVKMPSWTEEWQLDWKTKKELLGKKHQILVGGKTEFKDEEKPNDRASNAKEPVSFHSPPLELYEELLHCFYAKMVFDLTPLDARFAYAALRNRVGYVGVAYNPEHERLMEERLMFLLEKDMRDSTSPLFSAAYSEAVGVQTAATPEPAPKAKPQAKPKPTPKTKTKAKAEPKCKPKQKPKPKPAPVPVPEDDEGEGAQEEQEDEEDEVWDPLENED